MAWGLALVSVLAYLIPHHNWLREFEPAAWVGCTLMESLLAVELCSYFEVLDMLEVPAYFDCSGWVGFDCFDSGCSD